MRPSIPRSIMKHMCMYENRICFLKISCISILMTLTRKKNKRCPCLSAVIDSSQ